MRLRGKQLDAINAALKSGTAEDFNAALQKTCAEAESIGQFVPARGSGEADPLVSELRSLATTAYPLCPEARLMLEMAVDAQLGKPIDVTRLLPNDKLSDAGTQASK